MAVKSNSKINRALPRTASTIQDGIIYVTEDRKVERFFESMSIADNIHRTAQAAQVSSTPFLKFAVVDGARMD